MPVPVRASILRKSVVSTTGIDQSEMEQLQAIMALEMSDESGSEDFDDEGAKNCNAQHVWAGFLTRGRLK
jgi:hypothetical protein